MAEIPNRIRVIVGRYIQALEENDIPIHQAVLFGSYAKGTVNEWSDIDMALVSDAFEGNWMKDRNKVRAITLSVSSDIQVMPYRPEDFNPEDPFVREILETGVRMH